MSDESKRAVVQSFPDVVFGAHEVITIMLSIWANMTLERLVLPSSVKGCFRLHAVRCGAWMLCEGVDVERFTTLEGPSPFGVIDLLVGQPVTLILENITSEEQKLEGAFVRGTELDGGMLFTKTVQAALDRGRALAASADTATYARGWLDAIDEIAQKRMILRHPQG